MQEHSHFPHPGWISPGPGRLIGLAHGVWALGLAIELGTHWAAVVAALPFHIFALLGCVLLGLGTPFFIALWGVGWVLLFLGNTAIVLHVAQGVFRPGLALDAGLLCAVIVSLALTGLLCIPRVMRLFSGHVQRLWARSPRFSVSFPLRLTHHGHQAEGNLVDVSRTGCSFVSLAKIPEFEMVVIEADAMTFPTGQVLWRKELESGYRYGVKFRGLLPMPTLVFLSSWIHLQEEGPAHRLRRQ